MTKTAVPTEKRGGGFVISTKADKFVIRQVYVFIVFPSKSSVSLEDI